MSNFKKASKQKLRIETSRGLLSVEQLWDLPYTELERSIRAVKKVLKKNDDDDLAFLDDVNSVDPSVQLQYDILKEVYLDKKAEAEARRNKAEKKAHNQKILELIAQKKEEDLKEKSAEELEKLLIN